MCWTVHIKMTIHAVSETRFGVRKAVFQAKAEDKDRLYPEAEIL